MVETQSEISIMKAQFGRRKKQYGEIKN
jgi:hypothetical protein